MYAAFFASCVSVNRVNLVSCMFATHNRVGVESGGPQQNVATGDGYK